MPVLSCAFAGTSRSRVREERERERSDAMTRRGEKKEDALFDDAGSRKRSTDDKTRPLLREETRAL